MAKGSTPTNQMFNFSEGCHRLSSTAQPHFKPPFIISVVKNFSKFIFLLVTGNGNGNYT